MPKSVKPFAYQAAGVGVLAQIYGVAAAFLDSEGGLNILLISVWLGLVSVYVMMGLLRLEQRLEELESKDTGDSSDA